VSDSDSRTRQIAVVFSKRRELARDMLRKQMDARGLTEKAGWRITESLRHVAGGTQLVLKPIHLREHAPEGLEYVVSVSEEGTSDLTASPKED